MVLLIWAAWAAIKQVRNTKYEVRNTEIPFVKTNGIFLRMISAQEPIEFLMLLLFKNECYEVRSYSTANIY